MKEVIEIWKTFEILRSCMYFHAQTLSFYSFHLHRGLALEKVVDHSKRLD